MFDQHIPPTLPDHYTSRINAELQLHNTILHDDDNKPLTLLYGESGTGKSTLVAHVIQSLDIEKRFPGGVFWVNHPEPMLSNYLWKQLYTLNPSWKNRPRLSNGDLQKEFWNELDKCNALFVLDNVTEVGQIHELLFGNIIPKEERMHTVIRSRLIRVLDETLNDSELQDLCLELDIDYDSLPASGKKFKIREMVDYCHRYTRVSQLIVHYQRVRPNRVLCDLLPGKSRILVLSRQHIKNLPLPHHTQVLTDFNEREALALFEQRLGSELYYQYLEYLPTIARQRNYKPQLIDIAARELREKKLWSKVVGANPEQQHTGSDVPNFTTSVSEAVANPREHLHPITMYISKAQLRSLWQNSQAGNEDVGGI